MLDALQKYTPNLIQNVEVSLSLPVVYLWLVINSGTQRVIIFVKKQLGDFACIFISMKTDEEGDGAFGGGVLF